jgi:hypothetical protein
MSGINAINYYSPTLFASVGVSDTSLYTGIYGLLKAAASVVFFIFLGSFYLLASLPSSTLLSALCRPPVSPLSPLLNGALLLQLTLGVVAVPSCSAPSLPDSACSTLPSTSLSPTLPLRCA